jgi:hypothetical protein
MRYFWLDDKWRKYTTVTEIPVPFGASPALLLKADEAPDDGSG